MDGLITDFLRPARRLPSVLYVEDFDEAPAPAEDPPVIIAPGYTAEDVESAREEGRQAGLDEARTEHDTLQSALRTASLAAIADALAAGRADAATVATRMADDIAATLLALLQAALPATTARLAPAEITALLHAILPPLRREPGVTLRVHPDILPFVATQCAGFTDLTAAADPALAPSDVIVTWRDGEACRDWATLWRGITDALAPFALPTDLATLIPNPEGPHHGG
jgi:flagellar biosynthesis/type III secretory pathway protein FliH